MLTFNYTILVERQHKVAFKNLKSCDDISITELSLGNSVLQEGKLLKILLSNYIFPKRLKIKGSEKHKLLEEQIALHFCI